MNLLCIDPGAHAGAAYDRHDGALVLRACATAQERTAAVRDAMLGCGMRPFVVAAENWNVGGGAFRNVGRARGAAHGLSSKTILGLGAAWGWWQQAIEIEGSYTLGRAKFPKVLRVYPETWKRAVLGRARPPREVGEKLTLLRARDFIERERKRRVVVGDVSDVNVAVACAIYEWARKAPEVLALAGNASVAA